MSEGVNHCRVTSMSSCGSTLALAGQTLLYEVPANAAEKTEEGELQELMQLETGQQGVPAVIDDAIEAIRRSLLPPEKCQPDPNTDFGEIAVRWGLTHHVSNVGECCKAWSKQASYAGGGQQNCYV